MYLHLGQDVVVPASSILGVYDMDTATWSKHTRALIASMEKAGRVQSIFEDLPKSCILCEEGGVRTLYISQLSTATLLRRSEQGAAEQSARLDFVVNKTSRAMRDCFIPC